MAIKRTWTGKVTIHYQCSKCGCNLTSPPSDAGTRDKCPSCGLVFTVPGEDELRAEMKERAHQREMEEQKRTLSWKLHQERKTARQKSHRNIVMKVLSIIKTIVGGLFKNAVPLLLACLLLLQGAMCYQVFQISAFLLPVGRRHPGVPVDIRNSEVPVDIQNYKLAVDIQNSEVPVNIQNSEVPVDIQDSAVAVVVVNKTVPVDIKNSEVPVDIRKHSIRSFDAIPVDIENFSVPVHSTVVPFDQSK